MDGTTLVMYVLLITAAIIIYVSLVRAVFRINTLVEELKSQTSVLKSIEQKLENK